MPNSSIRLDFSFCLKENLRIAGVDKNFWEDMQPEVNKMHVELERQWQEKILGFWDLPNQEPSEINDILSLADLACSQADNLVVLGIGGSALGTTAIDMALSGVFRLANAPRKNTMKIWMADNSDPRLFFYILNNLDPQRTVYNVISKSGATAETMAQFMVLIDRLTQKLGHEEAIRRIIFTTDPKDGVLRQLAGRESYVCLDIPPNVGGRYSVLSPVGLFPLACAGYDIRALLEGASRMSARCLVSDIMQNPAYMFAALNVQAMRNGRNILVMMPYVSDLFGMAQWFAQLWGESLGKNQDLQGKTVNVGQTPVSAVGATDQHSQMQLYMEGPHDKIICFVTLENYGRDLEIPAVYPEIPALSYLGGRSMSELIQAEARATAAALALEGRPNMTIRLPAINENTLGQMIFMLEVATVASGIMLDINPLDQPGVELSKNLTYSLMGRKGYGKYKKDIEELTNSYMV